MVQVNMLDVANKIAMDVNEMSQKYKPEMMCLIKFQVNDAFNLCSPKGRKLTA
jgi:hypothetical protein